MSMRLCTLLSIAILGICGSAGALAAKPEQITLAKTASGATAVFTRAAAGWGISIESASAPRLSQPEPARVEISEGSTGAVHRLRSAYQQTSRTPNGVEATAVLRFGPAVSFLVRDLWQLQDEILSVQRTVTVQGTAPGGFSSSVLFAAPTLAWKDASYLAPGVLYADPTYDGEHSPGGTALYAAHHLSFREDILPAPMLGLYFHDGASIAMLDPAPRGDTTEAESQLAQTVMTDARFQFGSFSVTQAQAPGSPLAFGFQYPGSVQGYFAGHGSEPVFMRRYHPIQDGFRKATASRFGSATTPALGLSAATAGAGRGPPFNHRYAISTYLPFVVC